MKSPTQIAEYLARQWQRADWREQHLLNARDAWPLALAVGLPDARDFRESGTALHTHLQQWQTIARHGPGRVQWMARRFREGSAPINVPTHWVLARPSECMTAIERLAGTEGAPTLADHAALAKVLADVDARFHRLLLRRLALWRATPVEQVVLAARIALRLEPGCADGKPLRTLAIEGNDSKFFERNATLIRALLDERFDGEATRQGLAAFLDARDESEHWLLISPLAPGLLPFARQRVPADELRTIPLPCRNIIVVENERCLHQLPCPLPDTVAVLGAGLDLGWLSAPWLRECNVAYWGDMDTWGLHMLAIARGHLPHLHALLMDRASFDAHQSLAVPEFVHAPEPPLAGLAPEQAILDTHLRSLTRGRLEQEFLPTACVTQAVDDWCRALHHRCPTRL